MIIDLDSHLYDGWYLDEVYKLDPPYEAYSPRRIRAGHDPGAFTNDLTPRNPQGAEARKRGAGPRDEGRQAQGMDMDHRWQDVQREGIGAQFLFPTDLIKAPWTAGGVGAAFCHAYNSWAHGLVDGHRDHFFPVGLAPFGCPDVMEAELRRCTGDLGFKAMHLAPHGLGRNLDDPSFYPYYQAAQDLDIPLFCHPGIVGDYSSRFDNFFSMHVVGRPVGCLTALIPLVTGGVFERFPRLKVVFFECSAEFIVYWMHRLEDDWETVKGDPYHDHLKLAPEDYIRRNCYVTCEADEKLLGVTLSEFNENNVLMGTDYPHYDSTFPNTVSTIRSREDISEHQKQLIVEDNAAALVKL